MESFLPDIMDSISWITAVLAVVVCLLFYIYIQWSHMPPGPTGLPYLGYYPFLRNDYHVQLQNMVKKYGDVFCIKCTGQMYVYLGSHRAVKEAHLTKADCFAARYMNVSMVCDSFGEGVAMANGEKWKILKKFFVQKLKDFGSGKKTQETLMGDFLQRTVNTMRKKSGENFDAMDFFTNTCSRAIHQMLLSGTKVDDDDIKALNVAFSSMMECMTNKKMLLTGPLYKYLMLHVQPEFRKFRKNKIRLETIFTKIIDEHERDFDKDNIRDLIDCYINERKELEEKSDPKSEILSGKALLHSLVQIIGDGGFSIGFVIAEVLKKLALHPEVQKEIQNEIDDIVGRSRFPSWDDRSRMPYTNAAIYECFRTGDLFPAFPSLECTKETTLSDCHVPKGAITLVNYFAALHDPEVYDQPEKFDPTRFLPNNEQKSRCEMPIIFGVGKRSCMGESLVLMQTYLFVTTVLQNFDLHPLKDDSTESPDKKKQVVELNIFFRATPRIS